MKEQQQKQQKQTLSNRMRGVLIKKRGSNPRLEDQEDLQFFLESIPKVLVVQIQVRVTLGAIL